MSDKRNEKAARPDLVGNDRPIALRSVIAAHAMIPKPRPETNLQPPSRASGYALPAGFHNPTED